MKVSILDKVIKELDFSPEFLIMAEVNDFQTLSDIASRPLYAFHRLPYSGYRMLRELVNLLDAHGLMHLVR